MEQKLILDFMSLGPITRKSAAIACQVYLELCEVKRYYNVEYKYNEILQALYLTAQKSKLEPSSIFIPYDASEILTFNKIKDFFQLSTNNPDNRSVFLALVSADSTCVYYQMNDGLIEPTKVTVKHLRENKQEKLDGIIKKHRALLEDAALCGLSVPIPKNKPPP